MITKMNEYKEFQQGEMLVELAKINKGELSFDVCVFGGSSYSGGRNEHGEPHFHVADNIKKPDKFKLSVKIPTIDEWKANPQLIILPEESSQTNWDGLNKIKKDLMVWMGKPYTRNKRVSNLFTIIDYWNTLNESNRNVRQVPNDGEDLFLIIFKFNSGNQKFLIGLHIVVSENPSESSVGFSEIK